MEVFKRIAEKNLKNFIFLGEAGSGKSEIALNFAINLNSLDKREVHFFDMDMTKPLYRSRTVIDEIEETGIVFHHEEQFMDAPTLVGGVLQLLRNEECYVVLDVGGDHIGARAVGGFSQELNKKYTKVYYVLNAFRPWSMDIDHIDKTLVDIMGVANTPLERISMINNPNLGSSTKAEDFISGYGKMKEMISPYKDIDFSCVNETLVDEVRAEIDGPLMPVHLYLKNPWL